MYEEGKLKCKDTDTQITFVTASLKYKDLI